MIGFSACPTTPRRYEPLPHTDIRDSSATIEWLMADPPADRGQGPSDEHPAHPLGRSGTPAGGPAGSWLNRPGLRNTGVPGRRAPLSVVSPALLDRKRLVRGVLARNRRDCRPTRERPAGRAEVRNAAPHPIRVRGRCQRDDRDRGLTAW